MTIYLDYEGFQDLSSLPRQYLCDVNDVHPGWIEKQIDYWSRWLDARLRKRYNTPFNAFDATPDATPIEVQGWIARIVSLRLLLKRGVDPNDEQFVAIQQDAQAAFAEISEAANGEIGLFDLPTNATNDASLITRGGPRAYSEASPYVYRDVQSESFYTEESSGRGTTYE